MCLLLDPKLLPVNIPLITISILPGHLMDPIGVKGIRFSAQFAAQFRNGTIVINFEMKNKKVVLYFFFKKNYLIF